MPDWKPEIRRRLANLKLEPTREAAMVEEFAQHLEDCYAESRARGASEEEASRAALAELSERHRLAEELRRVERQVKSEPVVLGARRGNMLGEINQDLRYGARILRRSPGFTAVAVLSLALGIGANTAIFTLVDAVLLKLLPVRNPQELIIVAHSGKNAPSTSSNYPMYELFRDHNRSLAGLTAFWPMDLKVQADAETRTVAGQFVTGNYFALLGVPAAAGRTITAGDEAAPDVAVISHGFWRRHFGADPGVVGRTLVVNRTPLTIVGVTAPDFWGLEAGSPVDVSVPLTLQPRILSEYGNRLTERGGWWGLCLVGRLKPGVTAEPARADLDLLLRQWLAAEKVPEQTINNDFARAELLPGSRGLDALRRRFSQPLLVLAAVVAAVLLVACANIANLLLARAAARRKEVAVRLALGASRGRLIRQLLTESCLLAASGGALGLLFGWWGSGLLVAFIASGPGRVALEVRPDPRVLAFTAGVSLLTGIVVGLAPAFRSTRVDLTPALKAGATGSGISHPRGSAGRTLVAAQLALSLVLVIGATLFASSLHNLTAVDVGMRVENLLLVTFDSIGTGYDRGRRVAFYRAALERVQGLPGVSAAAMSSLSPLSGDDSTRFLDVPGFAARTPDDHVIHLNYVSAGYFETMGIPVSRGREFAPQDAAGARRVVALNETAARFYFAGADPVGKVVRVGRGADSPPLEIVGVVKDSKRQDPREAPERVVYLPALQYAQPFMTLEIRTALDPTAVAAGVRQALSEVNRDIPVREIRTARAQLEGLLVQERLLATLSGFFGALALLLAALGLSGTLSQLVARRTGEIGIRIALGAQRGDVLRLVLGEAARAVLIGVAVGLLAAWAVGRLVTGLLFGLTAMNPVAHLISIAGLLATAAVAAYLPARRATRVDPMVALRDE